MIGVYFPASSLTVEQYNSINDEIQSLTGGDIEGMTLHTCFREGDKLAMFDVWESQEAFEAFGAKLMPIVQGLGISMSPPQFVEMIACDIA